jgi:hypothetical protein
VSVEYTYDYAIVRVVPRVDRGEQINVGVILSCVDAEFLDSRLELDPLRLLALDPTLDIETVRTSLSMIPRVCKGGPDAGPIGALPQRSRFRWLVSPRSTTIQVSAVHTGCTADPAAALDHLLATLVTRPASS